MDKFIKKRPREDQAADTQPTSKKPKSENDTIDNADRSRSVTETNRVEAIKRLIGDGGVDGIEKQYMGKDWFMLLEGEFKKPYFEKVPLTPTTTELNIVAQNPICQRLQSGQSLSTQRTHLQLHNAPIQRY